MKALYICAGIFMAAALVFCGIQQCWSDQGEIMSNAKLASLIFNIKKLQMPVGTESLSEEEIYKIQADMLAAKNITQFANLKHDGVVTKGLVADLIYDSIFGLNNVKTEDKVAYLAKKGYMRAGGKDEAIFVALSRPEAYEVITNMQLAGLLFDMFQLELPQGAEGLSGEELYKLQASMLAEEGTTQFAGLDPNALVTKGLVADLFYSRIVTASVPGMTTEDKINYFAQQGYLTLGGTNNPVALGSKPVAEAYGVPRSETVPTTPEHERPLSPA